MSAVTDFNAASPPDHELAPYRAVCRTAVISAVMAAVSLPLVTLALVSMKYQVGDAVPLGMLGALFAGAALVLGIVGVRTVRRYPTEYTGGKLAHAGVIGGLILLVAGSASAADLGGNCCADLEERIAELEATTARLTRLEAQDAPKYADVERVAQHFIDEFTAGKIDSVHVAYMNFISAGQQKPEIMTLLPLAGVTETKEQQGQQQLHAETVYDFLPNAKELLDELLSERDELTRLNFNAILRGETDIAICASADACYLHLFLNFSLIDL
jgi:hypothetical protein